METWKQNIKGKEENKVKKEYKRKN